MEREVASAFPPPNRVCTTPSPTAGAAVDALIRLPVSDSSRRQVRESRRLLVAGLRRPRDDPTSSRARRSCRASSPHPEPQRGPLKAPGPPVSVRVHPPPSSPTYSSEPGKVGAQVTRRGGSERRPDVAEEKEAPWA